MQILQHLCKNQHKSRETFNGYFNEYLLRSCFIINPSVLEKRRRVEMGFRTLFYNHSAFFKIIVKSPTDCTIYLKKTLCGSLKYFGKHSTNVSASSPMRMAS
jgi:hypothetical protein